ncbi:MAG: PLP-dependent transferase [Clostridia bacterium]|nr:PLP-dependent transferase [Clostridia bacterium]
MKTPVCDFVEDYQKQNITRLHMPGHKGVGKADPVERDITEISGADVLYRESGILAESQRNATTLFGTEKTLYSTEGSTLAIRAMLTLAVKYAALVGKKPVIAAGRNAHKAFLTSCALLDLSPVWLYPESSSSLLSCKIDPKELTAFFEGASPMPTALYLTSPDYLGNVCDIEGIASVCKTHGVLLLVDNAHGAYLQFLPESIHPIALGADLCCDSAHKTLPVLTGGAYLHVSKNAPKHLALWAEEAISLYSSTSPSYLILQSLDRCNPYLNDVFQKELIAFIEKTEGLKKSIRRLGFPLTGDEPLKITLMPKAAGYTGEELATLLREHGMECEFADPDYTVLMLSPIAGERVLNQLHNFFERLPLKEPILRFPPQIPRGTKSITPREAMLAPSETVPISLAKGRILAEAGVNCPPAVPIAVCGEILDDAATKAFKYYGIQSVRVVIET